MTLTGTGGVGKTRAATELGWLFSDEYPDGVWLVELAPVVDESGVLAATAGVMSVRQQQGATVLESIVDWLRHRRVLLIVDNCEHVLGPAAELVAAINAECATVTVLATIREPLGLRGERVHVVASLDPSAEGSQLFRDRAVAADAAFDAQPDDTGVIETICTRLDGIPLAIELAAARTRSLAPADVLARLDDRFRLLRGAGRGGLERHQTLRATVAWSYQLLNADERKVFDRASVFAGPFDVTAAEQVSAHDDVDPDDVLDLLTSLVDKSMVVATRDGGSTRYRFLETLRRYGEERLADSGDSARTRDLHLAHYASVAQAGLVLVSSARQVEGNRLFEDAWDNLRGAFNWAIASDQIVLASTVLHGSYRYSNDQHRSEHRQWGVRLLPIAERDRSVLLMTTGPRSRGAWSGNQNENEPAAHRVRS